MKRFTKKIIAGVLASVVLAGVTPTVEKIQKPASIYAENASHWYSQKGWTYNGKSLTSLCYITSYAMILRTMGYDANPVDVYVANGKSNYCNHSLIAKNFGVDATSETGSLSSKSQAEKQKFIKDLLAKYPQGVIVGGNYGGGTHYIIAKKIVKDTIYFDDPAYTTEAEGCCIPVCKITVPKPTEILNAKPTTTYNPLGKYKVPTRTIYYKSSVMQGDDVKWVEASLKKLGYAIKVNGKYSKADSTIVKKYQKKKGLAADGHVGKKTLSKLISDIEIAVTKVAKVSGLQVTENTIEKASTDSSKEYNVSASWKGVSNASGYILLYATESTFSNNSKVGKKKTSVSIPNLKKGKTYYFKVRAYKTVNGTRVYGKYSTVKKIKIS